MSWKHFVATGLASAALVQACSKNCTEMGCNSGFGWRLDSPLTMEDLEAAQIEACRNEVCVRGPTRTATLEAGEGEVVALGGGEDGPVALTVQRAVDGQVELELMWSPEPGLLEAGDQYRITLFDASGEQRLTREYEVEAYRTFFPNGAECDDAACRVAALDERGESSD